MTLPHSQENVELLYIHKNGVN